MIQRLLGIDISTKVLPSEDLVQSIAKKIEKRDISNGQSVFKNQMLF